MSKNGPLYCSITDRVAGIATYVTEMVKIETIEDSPGRNSYVWKFVVN